MLLITLGSNIAYLSIPLYSLNTSIFHKCTAFIRNLSSFSRKGMSDFPYITVALQDVSAARDGHPCFWQIDPLPNDCCSIESFGADRGRRIRQSRWEESGEFQCSRGKECIRTGSQTENEELWRELAGTRKKLGYSTVETNKLAIWRVY